MRSLAILACCAALTAGAGCATLHDTHELQRRSARAITPTPNPDSVTITNVRRDRMGNINRWVATTRRGVFDCSIEVDEHSAICAQRDP